MKFFLPALLFSAAVASSAYAQNWRAWNDPNKGVRVTANFQIAALAGPTASAADLTAALAQVSQQFYEIVNRQCDVIAAALKGQCHVVQLNVNGNVNDRMNAGQMV